MVLATIETLDQYASLHPSFPAAFDALRKLAGGDFVPGRHEVEGDRIFINCAEYETKPAADSCMEYHKEYIDVMWMVEGEETIGVFPTCDLKHITRPYEPDAALAELEKEYTALRMVPGSVCILFPEDAHAPSMQLSGKCTVRKMIAKVRV